MTRTPRRPADGKPLPQALREFPVIDDTEEPTERTRMLTDDELDAERRLHADAGQGRDWFSYRRSAL